MYCSPILAHTNTHHARNVYGCPSLTDPILEHNLLRTKCPSEKINTFKPNQVKHNSKIDVPFNFLRCFSCDTGYAGDACDTVTKKNSIGFYEDFENDILPTRWLSIVGATTTRNGCGTLASGRSLYFNQVGVSPFCCCPTQFGEVIKSGTFVPFQQVTNVSSRMRAHFVVCCNVCGLWQFCGLCVSVVAAVLVVCQHTDHSE